MKTYDDQTTGIENPENPANQIEVYDEKELTEDELKIQSLESIIKDFEKEHDAIKRMHKAISEKEAKEGIYAACLGMNEEEEKEYLHLKNCLAIKINRL